MFPNAIYRAEQGVWCNPSKLPTNESLSMRNAACLQSVYPELPASRHPSVRFIARMLRNLDNAAPITGSLINEGNPKDKAKITGVFF